MLRSADTAWWGCAAENCIGYAMECKPRLKEAEPPAVKAELFRKDCWPVQISIFWQARRATLYCIFLPKSAQQKNKTNKKEREREKKIFIFSLLIFILWRERSDKAGLPQSSFLFPSLSIKGLFWRLWEYVNIKQHFPCKGPWRITEVTAHSFFLQQTPASLHKQPTEA